MVADGRIAVFERIELCKKCGERFFINIRTVAVELGFLLCFDLDIDAGISGFQPYKICFDALCTHPVFDRLAGESGGESERSGCDSKLLEDNRHIDALAAEIHLLG